MAFVMACGLEPQAQAELHRALHAQLHPEPEPSAWRIKNLGPLARMLDRWPDFMGRYHEPDVEWWDQPWPQVPVIPRHVYNEQRPPGAPDAGRLVEQFGGKDSGGWLRVCRAAYGLLPDGRYVGKGRPRPTHRMLDGGNPARQIWDKDACATAVRRCALDIGRVPSSTDYTKYQRAKSRALNHGDRVQFGLPTVQTVQRYLGAWPRVLKAARIANEDLIAARATWAPTPEPTVAAGDSVLDRLALLDDVGLLRVGISAKKRDRLVQLGATETGHGVRGLEKFPLRQACQLAAALGGSISWLLGTDPEPGKSCPTDLSLDGEAVREWIDKRGLQHTGVRSALWLTLSQWRHTLSGDQDRTVAEVLRLAEILNVPPASLLLDPPGERHG